jgi:hypothetical protein
LTFNPTVAVNVVDLEELVTVFAATLTPMPVALYDLFTEVAGTLYLSVANTLSTRFAGGEAAPCGGFFTMQALTGGLHFGSQTVAIVQTVLTRDSVSRWRAFTTFSTQTGSFSVSPLFHCGR